jgi:hypothetical protein
LEEAAKDAHPLDSVHAHPAAEDLRQNLLSHDVGGKTGFDHSALLQVLEGVGGKEARRIDRDNVRFGAEIIKNLRHVAANRHDARKIRLRWAWRAQAAIRRDEEKIPRSPFGPGLRLIPVPADSIVRRRCISQQFPPDIVNDADA